MSALAMRPLVCSTAHLPTSSHSEPWGVPNAGDWATMYDDIERLYIRERRKLRYVMRFVETKYHLKAT
jgi:hypothetical protein